MAADPSSSTTQPPAPIRSVAEIEADLAATRESLISTVDQLQVAVKQTLDPKRILAIQVTRVRSIYVDEYGGIRPERVAVTVGVVVGAVVIKGVFKRAFKKS